MEIASSPSDQDDLDHDLPSIHSPLVSNSSTNLQGSSLSAADENASLLSAESNDSLLMKTPLHEPAILPASSSPLPAPLKASLPAPPPVSAPATSTSTAAPPPPSVIISSQPLPPPAPQSRQTVPTTADRFSADQLPSPPTRLPRSTSDPNTDHLQASKPTPLARFASDPTTPEEKATVIRLHDNTDNAASTTTANNNNLGRRTVSMRFTGVIRRMERTLSLPRTGSLGQNLVDLEAGENGRSSISSNNNKQQSSETFYCTICLENCAKSLSFSASSCELRHEYCYPCMSGYTDAQVQDGVIEHTCPGMGQCTGTLSMSELQSLLSEASFSRLERLRQVKTNPNYRECPQCNAGMTAETKEAPDGNSSTPGATKTVPVSAELVCGSCSCKFCFFHSNAHPGINCETYSRRLSTKTKRDMAASERVVGRTTRSCPQCHAATEKNGGCNHMTCQSCHANWCWLCGRSMDDVTEHYAATNMLGCPGSQFTDESIFSLPRCCSIIYLCGDNACTRRLRSASMMLSFFIFRVIPVFILGLIVGSLWLALDCVCCPFMAIYSLVRRKFELEPFFFIGATLPLFLVLLFTLTIDLVLFPFVSCGYMCSMCRQGRSSELVDKRVDCCCISDQFAEHVAFFSVTAFFLSMFGGDS